MARRTRPGPPPRILARRLKLPLAQQLEADIEQVLEDARVYNASRGPRDAPVDPDPKGALTALRHEARLRIDSEVWRKRARRPKV